MGDSEIDVRKMLKLIPPSVGHDVDSTGSGRGPISVSYEHSSMSQISQNELGLTLRLRLVTKTFISRMSQLGY